MQAEELGDERSTNVLDDDEICGPVSPSDLTKDVRLAQVRAETEDSRENREESMTPVARELKEQSEALGSKMTNARPGVSLVRPFQGSARVRISFRKEKAIAQETVSLF